MSVAQSLAPPSPATPAILREARRAPLRACAEDPLLNITVIEGEAGLGRKTIGRRIKAGTFPPPVNDDGWRLWRRSHLEAWKVAGAAWRSLLPEEAEN